MSYYALFHTICRNAADLLVGTYGRSGHPENKTWTLVYRGLNHGQAKDACKKKRQKIPASVRDFAREFIQAQEKRHEADYDPSARFRRSDVVQRIESAEKMIEAFKIASKPDRKAFVALLLFKER